MEGMVQLRIALAQVDTTVGDLAGNAETVLRWSRAAAEAEADLVLFPELALTGYPPEDLVFRESFRSASVRARDELARTLADAGLGELAVIVGYVDSAGGPRNACAVLYRGEGRGHLLQAPPAQLRRLRRGALLRARRPVRGRPDPRRRRGADDLRRPLAGRRTVRGRRPGRGRPDQLHQRLPVRAEQGRRAAAAGGPAGR
jgi:hypothetical protein